DRFPLIAGRGHRLRGFSLPRLPHAAAMIAESAGQSRGPRPDAFAVRFRSRATEACVIASNPGVFRAEALRWIRDPELIAAGAVKRRRDRRRCGSLETACQDGQS